MLDPKTEKDGVVRLRVALALAAAGEKEAVPTLIQLIEEYEAALRERVRQHFLVELPARPAIVCAENIAFVGLGHKFQIWEPERFRAQLAEATEKVRALKKRLSSRRAARDALGARE